jgi:hypothetical protein
MPARRSRCQTKIDIATPVGLNLKLCVLFGGRVELRGDRFVSHPLSLRLDGFRLPPHSDIADIEKWLRMRILSEHTARRLRDILLELYPLPLPRVPVTDPDASTEDDIGLH